MARLSNYSARNLGIYFNSQQVQIDGQLTERLISFISGTTFTLDVAIYDLTDASVLQTLAAVGRARGKKLQIAFDASGEQPTNATSSPKPRQDTRSDQATRA